MKSLFEVFNLGREDLDPGLGILYLIKKSQEVIKTERDAIIVALRGRGVSMKDCKEYGIGVEVPKGTNEQELIELLIELSCLNEAMEYIDAGLDDINSIGELKDRIMAAYYGSLIERNMVDAYHLVSRAIPQIVKDLRIAHEQKKALNKEELKAVDELQEWAKRQEEALNSPGGVVIIGTKE